MVKICPNCGLSNKEEANFCGNCNMDLKELPPVEGMLTIKSEGVGWTFFDTLSIFGFVAPIFGLFAYAVILLPLGFILSLLGLKSKYLKGLSIAGLVVSLLAGIVKIMILLYEYDLIPYWITEGVFF